MVRGKVQFFKNFSKTQAADVQMVGYLAIFTCLPNTIEYFVNSNDYTMNKLTIPNPCYEDLRKMKSCSGGLHCGTCNTNLLDLRKKKKKEIKILLENNPEACIIIDKKYLEQHSPQLRFINKTENFLTGIKLKPVSVVLIAVWLFLSSCHKKHKHFVGKFKTEPREEMK